MAIVTERCGDGCHTSVCFYYPPSTSFCLSFPLLIFSSPVAPILHVRPNLLHMGSEMDNIVVTFYGFTSIKNLLEARTTKKDNYLPTYMVSATSFTIYGLPVHWKTGNCTASSTIMGAAILKNSVFSVPINCCLDVGKRRLRHFRWQRSVGSALNLLL